MCCMYIACRCLYAHWQSCSLFSLPFDSYVLFKAQALNPEDVENDKEKLKHCEFKTSSQPMRPKPTGVKRILVVRPCSCDTGTAGLGERVYSPRCLLLASAMIMKQ